MALCFVISHSDYDGFVWPLTTGRLMGVRYGEGRLSAVG